MLWYWTMWNVGKEKRFVCCCQFLGLKFLFMRRFSKINSTHKDVKLKSCIGHFLYCWQLFKDIHTLVGGSQLFKKQWCGVYCKCVVWIDIVIYLWILPNMHSYSLHPFNWMQFINDRKMNSCMNRWMTFKWMNFIHPFLNYIHLYNTFVL